MPTVRDSNEPEVRRANAGLRGVEPEEVQHVLGSSSWSAESLLHNRDNGVTRGVWRVSVDRDEPRHRDGWPLPERAVVKIVSSAPSGNPGSWRPSEKPNHWCYWRREPEIYQSDVPLLGDEVGLTLPNLLDVFERENEGAAEISLWLEDVEGLPGEDFSLAQHEEAAEALGRFQALASRRENGSHRPWASRGFLRDYSGFRVCPASTLDNDALWSTELVAETLGEDVRRAARLLLAERDSLLSVVEGLPTTLCHLDFWPKNLMRRESGESVVALDWAFAGYGAFGEDLGNYVPDCVMDHFVAADDLQALEEATWRGYLRGLQECGWNGDEQIVRLGVYASAVKYSWLLPTMLGQLERGESKKYGGGPADDLVLQLTERGKAIVHLAGWVEKARKLAFP
ncbi:MAG: aminoglycoside phosphotransferase family protein [Acidobacteriota bacterium]